MLKDSAFQNKWIAVFQLGFQVRKILQTFVKQDPGLAENGRELGQKWWKTMRGSRWKNKTDKQQQQQNNNKKAKTKAKNKESFPTLSISHFFL